MSVIPQEIGQDYPLEPLKPGTLPNCRTATGEPVQALGRKQLTCCFNNGSVKTMSFLVMDVTRPLASVSQMIKQSCRVVFDGPDGEGSFILHKPSGDKHKLFLKGGIFILPVWVLAGPMSTSPPASDSQYPALAPMVRDGENPLDFGRQALL